MKIKGSFTIEASIIFPLVLLVLVTMITIGLYLHEMTVLQGIANAVSDHSGEILKVTDEKQWEERMKEEVYQLAQNAFLLQPSTLNVTCEVTQGLISYHLELRIKKNFKTPFRSITQLMNGSNNSFLTMEVCAKSKHTDPTRFIRGIDFLDDVSSEITLTKDLKDKYREMMDGLESMIDEWV